MHPHHLLHPSPHLLGIALLELPLQPPFVALLGPSLSSLFSSFLIALTPSPSPDMSATLFFSVEEDLDVFIHPGLVAREAPDPFRGDNLVLEAKRFRC